MRSLIRCAFILLSLTVPALHMPAQMAPHVLAQMPPHGVSIIRNESDTDLTIEYRTAGEWKSVNLAHGKDTALMAERVRVATVRPDKATVTVDYPVAPAGKYRLLWNTQAGMWDFSPAVGSSIPQ